MAASKWPAWPEGEKGGVMFDAMIEKNIDELFLLMFGGWNEYRVGDLP